MRARERLVIVGGGMAAARLLDELHNAGASFHTTLVGQEVPPPYNRILLSSLLAGDVAATDITLALTAQMEARRVRFRGGVAATAIDRSHRLVHTDGGDTIPYDRLVLATGSNPVMPPIPGRDLKNVFAFRDMADVDNILQAAKLGGKAVVIGGGLLGLEAAAGLVRRGLDTTVLHLMQHLMERQLDDEAATLLALALNRRGITIKLATHTEAILGTTRVEAVKLRNGATLPADLVVIATGIRPNVELARQAGLAVGRGILVGDTLGTNDASIFALGECIEHCGEIFGLVAPIWEQARILAHRLAGDRRPAYSGTVSGTALKVSGIDVYSAGAHDGTDVADECIVLRDPATGIYRKLVIRDDRLVGVVLFGDVTDGPWYFELIRAAAPLGALRTDLIFGRRFVGPEDSNSAQSTMPIAAPERAAA